MIHLTPEQPSDFSEDTSSPPDHTSQENPIKTQKSENAENFDSKISLEEFSPKGNSDSGTQNLNVSLDSLNADTPTHSTPCETGTKKENLSVETSILPLDSQSLQGKKVRFIGHFGSMSQQEIARILREKGVKIVTSPSERVDWLIAGERKSPFHRHSKNSEEDWLIPEIRDAVDEGRIRIATESQLLQQLYPEKNQKPLTSLYTPHMLADLLGVSTQTVRRWMMLGFIAPARTIKRLPYFDLHEVFSAQRLAMLLNHGVSMPQLERNLMAFQQQNPHILDQLADCEFIVDGQKMLIRTGKTLIESSGQYCFDFERAESDSPLSQTAPHFSVLPSQENRELHQKKSILPLHEDIQDFLKISPSNHFLDSALSAERETFLLENDALRAIFPQDTSRLFRENKDSWYIYRTTALALADAGELGKAEEIYRTILLSTGSSAEDCFELGDILYRQHNLLGARERFSMAVEMDEDFVEARVSLGCVLGELGELDLSISSLEGAIAFHPDYADAYYHLAKILAKYDRKNYAEECWRRYLTLVDTNSPTAQEVKSYLAQMTTEELRDISSFELKSPK
ncbi:MAG: hypothetical protein Q4C96_05730 [Planctomycetia bacterium]|nr:hypothetical protein [Planctomycetia bacterium]